jgi:hypothetical protein
MLKPNTYQEYGTILDRAYFEEYVRSKFQNPSDDIMKSVGATDLSTLIEVYCLENGWKKQYGLIYIPYNKAPLPFPHYIINDIYYATSNIYEKNNLSIVLPIYCHQKTRKMKLLEIQKACTKRRNSIYLTYINMVLRHKYPKKTTKYLLKNIYSFINCK